MKSFFCSCYSRIMGKHSILFLLRKTGLVFSFICLFGVCKNANSEKQTASVSGEVVAEFLESSSPFKVEKVAEGLGVVWAIEFISSDELLFTEKKGKLKHLHLKTGKITSLSGVPGVYTRGQGGLMDVVLHPKFKDNRLIYLSYSKKIKKEGQTTVIAKAKLSNNSLSDLREIFVAKPVLSSSIHFGSRMVFDKDYFLFVAIGDRYNRHFAQRLNTHMGKILRLTEEGNIPSDNPFRDRKSALGGIWSLGHRNPQGLYIHPETKQLWAGEHGPRGGDEINLILKGKNYGWPVVTYGKEYWGPKIGEGVQKPGYENPVKYYVPSIAPGGLMIYSGKVFKKWKGDFFSGALVLRHLNKVSVKKGKAVGEERLLEKLKLRVRAVTESPEGYIFIGVDKGQILKLSPINTKANKGK